MKQLYVAVMAIAMCGLANAATFAGTTECAPQQIAKLTADDGASGDWFGCSVALDAGMAVIGAPADDDNGERQWRRQTTCFDKWPTNNTKS